jgi:repressor LexA
MHMKRENLFNERKKNGWTQEQVAKKIGITKSAYAHIERGTKTPSYKNVLLLEDLFNNTHRFLLH